MAIGESVASHHGRLAKPLVIVRSDLRHRVVHSNSFLPTAMESGGDYRRRTAHFAHGNDLVANMGAGCALGDRLRNGSADLLRSIALELACSRRSEALSA